MTRAACALNPCASGRPRDERLAAADAHSVHRSPGLLDGRGRALALVILGLADGADAGAALVVGDTLVSAVQQERLDRAPRSRAFPWDAARAVLARAGCAPGEVDVVAVAGRYTPPFAARRRPALLGLAKDPFSAALAAGTLWQEVLRGTGLGALEADRTAEWLEGRMREEGYAPRRVALVDLHKCLASAAYRCQPNDGALALVVHPRGDGALASVHEGVAGELDRVALQTTPATLHAFLDRCLAAMGLDPQLDGPRIEALAARGEPDPDCVHALGEVLSTREGELRGRALPPGRRSDRPWRLLAEAPRTVAAASVAAHLRDVLLAWVAWHQRRRRATQLALAGAWLDDGALVARIAELPGVEGVWAGPWTGASALAVGAALSLGGLPPRWRPDAGSAPDESECRQALDRPGVPAAPGPTADLLARGALVARFAGPDGPQRWGGGQRSVLVRADDPEGVARVREALGRTADEEPILLTLEGGPPALRGPLACGTVARGGRRIAVPEEPALVAILEVLRERGIPALAAFPFGRGAEPPVATPAEAAALWRESGLDALVLGASLVERY